MKLSPPFTPLATALLKYTTNTAEKHPHWLDEMPVGAPEIDGGREEIKRKNSFWNWPTLYFLCCRAAKYVLAQAEMDYQSEVGSYHKITLMYHDTSFD